LPDSNSSTRSMPGSRLLLAAIAFFCLGGIAAFALARKPSETAKAPGVGVPASWIEVAWPFPTDEWGQGKALRCQALKCGAGIQVYLRPKIGFCNCSSGLADDMELDRVSDFGLMGDGVVPVGEGKPIQVESMVGRTRIYSIGRPGDERFAISAAFNNNCDVIVATAIVDRSKVVVAQSIALEFLSTEYVLGWA